MSESLLTEEEWASYGNIAYIAPVIKTKTITRIGFHGKAYQVRADTAWALLRHFRTGKDWGTEEVKRQWAEEEYRDYLERIRLKPKLVE